MRCAKEQAKADTLKIKATVRGRALVANGQSPERWQYAAAAIGYADQAAKVARRGQCALARRWLQRGQGMFVAIARINRTGALRSPTPGRTRW